MQDKITGSTRSSVGIQLVRKLKILVPSENEQQKIASILSNVDSLINQVNGIIEKSKVFKLGMTQQLFTKGIGHSKFKNVHYVFQKEIKIPYNWKFQKIKEISEKLVVGFVGTCDPFYTDNDGIPMLRTTNVNEGKLSLSNLKYVTKEFHEKNKKSQVYENDLLVSRHGESGEACIVRNFKEANCLNIVIIRCKKQILLPNFFEQAFNSNIVRKQIRRTTAGGVQGVINTGEIARVKIIIPPLSEQQKISSIISEVDSRFDKINQRRTYLISLKKGLMQKLLTGQIRV